MLVEGCELSESAVAATALPAHSMTVLFACVRRVRRPRSWTAVAKRSDDTAFVAGPKEKHAVEGLLYRKKFYRRFP